MKKLFLTLTIFFLASQVSANEIYRFDPSHTNIVWQANHFGFSSPSGKFTKSNGVIIFDNQRPQDSTVDITIDTSSIDTGDDKFNQHLMSADFLNAASFPTAKFVSTKILLTGPNSAKITGNFTLHGVTKSIILDAKMNKLATNPFTQKKTMGLSAGIVIKRSDFGIIYGIPGVSDEVKIRIEAEAIISTEEAPQSDNKDKKLILYEPNPKWNLVKSGSSISFKTKQGSSVINGGFTNFTGVINFNKDEQKGNKVSIEIDTSSLNIGFAQVLDTLKTDPWLAIEKFPKATLIAENFKALSGSKIHSDNAKLTIKGKTVPVSFDFEFSEYTKTEAIAIGSFTVKRSDFGVGGVGQNEVDDKVEISFKIKAQK